MSKYTTELRYICETSAGLDESTGFNDVEQVITNAAPVIFNFDFPIFDNQYKLPLEKKILRHFYTREICEETVGLWKLRLNDRLNLIMPFYNKLYESELLKFEPFYDVDYRNERSGSRTSNQEEAENAKQNASGNDYTDYSEQANRQSNDRFNKISTESGSEQYTGADNESRIDNSERSTNQNVSSENREAGTNADSSKHWDLYSDTPQGGINGIEGTASGNSVDGNYYLTNARKVTDNNSGSTTNEGSASSTTDGTENASSAGTTNRNKNENRERSNSISDSSNTTSDGSTSTESSRKAGHINVTENERNLTNQAQSLEQYADHIFGKRSGISFSKMLLEFRDTFLNIDAMIINELETLFMGVW